MMETAGNILCRPLVSYLGLLSKHSEHLVIWISARSLNYFPRILPYHPTAFHECANRILRVNGCMFVLYLCIVYLLYASLIRQLQVFTSYQLVRAGGSVLLDWCCLIEQSTMDQH
mmetsp:Transcript_93698/g.171763  ORF Transcript_93698/g.171763 Transcript_93698/m.171763 type:complete len:115 (+) Transcript_93698:162-506(+)